MNWDWKKSVIAFLLVLITGSGVGYFLHKNMVPKSLPVIKASPFEKLDKFGFFVVRQLYSTLGQRNNIFIGLKNENEDLTEFLTGLEKATEKFLNKKIRVIATGVNYLDKPNMDFKDALKILERDRDDTINIIMTNWNFTYPDNWQHSHDNLELRVLKSSIFFTFSSLPITKEDEANYKCEFAKKKLTIDCATIMIGRRSYRKIVKKDMKPIVATLDQVGGEAYLLLYSKR